MVRAVLPYRYSLRPVVSAAMICCFSVVLLDFDFCKMVATFISVPVWSLVEGIKANTHQATLRLHQETGVRL